MTRMTTYFLPTEKQAPADAEAISHKLAVRAGLVRQVGAGLWTWLPAGWRVHRKVEQIVREEMDAIGAQELLMPVLQPADAWRKTGRYGIDEVFKLKDRKGTEMLLAMTHEENVTTHVAQVVRSYRDLPLTLYHFQVKERDEPRPRAGVLRTREFIMKDAYTFDRDQEGLAANYELQRGAYRRIFERCGLHFYEVAGDVGMMGGTGAHEYLAPCPAGENDVALGPDGFAANVEIASAEPRPVELPALAGDSNGPVEVETPGLTTVAQVAEHLEVPAGALLKGYPIVVDDDRGLVLVVLRGDHRINEIKLRNQLGAGFRPARPDEFESAVGPAGYLGPVGASVPVYLDRGVEQSLADGRGFVCGGAKPDTHFKDVVPGRDFEYTALDIRTVQTGDTVDGREIEVVPAIEVGNIFQLGTRYSEPLGATYLDEDGKARPIIMGSYGIGPARVAAAVIEQTADEHGIAWPRALAPFDVHLVTLGKAGSEERETAERLYGELRDEGLDVIYDDRDAGPGQKFADAELLGVPLRLTVGRKGLQEGEVEVQIRRGRESRRLPLEGAAAAARELWATLP